MKSRVTRVLAAVAFVAIGSPTLLCGQAQNSIGSTRPNPQMVTLNVRLTDGSGHSVRDAAQGDFKVTEDGVPQPISFYSKEDVPLTYALLLDTSGSLRPQFNLVIGTAATVANNNQAGDETEIIRFISSDKIETVQAWTADKQLIYNRLSSLFIEAGQSAVIDAVYVTAQSIVERTRNENQRRRHVMILVTDGEDRASYYSQDKLFQFLGEHDVQIFVIGLVKDLKGRTKEKAVSLLTRLATDTGGRVFLPNSMDQLATIASEIVRDIRVQYLIGYVPTNSSPSFHKVQVTVAEKPGSEKRIAITRIGYSMPHN